MSSATIADQPVPTEKTKLKRAGAWWHTVLLIAIMLGAAVRATPARLTARLTRPHARPTYYALLIVYEIALFLYVWVLGLMRNGVTVREIIGGRWKNFGDFLLDVSAAFIFFFSYVVTAVVLVHLLGRTTAPTAVQAMLPRSGAEFGLWFVASICAGFCEEFICRGYLQRQFFVLTRNYWVANLSQGVFFGSLHLYQGWQNAVIIGVEGILFGVLAYIMKSLRPGMMAHFGQDSLGGLSYILASRFPPR
jgi:membrane protease YdiL (CAAX protease family)